MSVHLDMLAEHRGNHILALVKNSKGKTIGHISFAPRLQAYWIYIMSPVKSDDRWMSIYALNWELTNQTIRKLYPDFATPYEDRNV